MAGSGTAIVTRSAQIALLAIAALLATATLQVAAIDVESINQADTDKGPILIDAYVKQIQELADSQGGSTARLYDPDVVEPLLEGSTPDVPGLVAQNAVISEAKRKTRSNHAATIAEVGEGKFVAAWYAGTWEAMGDIAVWYARYKNGKWGKARKIANPKLDTELYDGKYFAGCWNPVLLYNDQTDTLFLFWKRGIVGEKKFGFLKRSLDGGKTWGKTERLPDSKGVSGPDKNPPIILPNGWILAGNSGGGFLRVEVSKDNGNKWRRRGETIEFDDVDLSQASLLNIGGGDFRMVARTRSGRVAGLDSDDKFKTVKDKYLTDVETWGTGTGVHAIVLRDGRIVMVYNTPEGRDELVLAVSDDNGDSYKEVLTLEKDDGDYPRTEECVDPDNRDEEEPNEFSYPTIVQSRFDDRLHIVYTYSYYGSGARCMGRENIKHVILDLSALDNRR